jgi:hypothetical protein
MVITNTVEGQLALMGFDSGNWVPEHEPYANLITQKRFGFLALLGNTDVSPEAKFDKTNFNEVPGLIGSSPSNSVQPKIDQYLTLPTEFTNGASAVTGWVAGTAKNVTLVSTAGIKAYDVLTDRATGSEISVVSVTSSTVVSAKPLAGGVSGNGTDDIAAGATLDLGSAWVDGATFGDGLRSTPETDYNYMQIQVDEYGEGLFIADNKYYPGQNSRLDVLRDQTRVLHNQKRELRMLFGSRSANTTVNSTGTIFTAAGLTGFSNRAIDAGGSVTLDEWNSEIMPDVTQYGGGDYHAMVGSKATAVWSKLAYGQIRTDPSDMKYGNRVRRVLSDYEEITLHGTDPMDKRPGEMLMFQPKLIQRKHFPKFNSVHLPEIQARNTAKKVNAYATVECIIPRNKDVIVTVEGVLA